MVAKRPGPAPPETTTAPIGMTMGRVAGSAAVWLNREGSGLVPWGALRWPLLPEWALWSPDPTSENPLRINRQQLQTIRKRHFGYRITLIYELLCLLLLPLAQLYSPLVSFLLIGLAVVLMVFVNRFSGMPRTRPVMLLLGCSALILELIWRGALAWQPALGRVITLPHVLVWLLFLLVVVIRGVQTLIREPFVTLSVLHCAVSGYLTLGISGGVMLTAVWVLQPSAFVASALPAHFNSAVPSGAVASALMTSSFGLLTTIGTQVLNPTNVTVQVLATLIAISGQLYIAVLIGLILGRVHRRLV